MYQVITPSAKNRQEASLFQHFFSTLPKKPYCTDELGFLSIRPKAQAIQKAYIQPNPIIRAYWLMFDLDHQQAPRYWAEEHHIPTPNLSVINPENGHEHIYYQIDPAVYTLRQARRKPLALAADVDRGLTRLLDADPGFGKLIAKNPYSTHWIALQWLDRAWGLLELLDRIPDRFLTPSRKPREEVGLGRNCTVFEKTRLFAYSEWRRQGFEDYQGLFDQVYQYGRSLNAGFTAPMTEREVRSITRSISKWTARHLTPEGFSRWCSKRGTIGNRKSQAVRKGKSDERVKAIRAYKSSHLDMSNRKIAKELGVSPKTVNNALRNLKWIYDKMKAHNRE